MRPFCAVALALSFPIASGAHSVETAIIAAMRLADVPNYSWTCSVMDDAQTYDIEGKTRDGVTWQRQPMPKIVARRLGREAGQDLESIFRGPRHYVIQTESGWKLLEELPKQHRDWIDDDGYYFRVSTGFRTPDMPANENELGTFGLPPAIYVPVLREKQEGRIYSNAQFALALPQDELAIIVSSHEEFVVEGNVASGTLTDLGAQLLLVHDGHEYITPVTAGGRFRIWFRGDTVEKYIVELAGIVVVNRKPIYVRQKSTTVLKDIGTTNFVLPADARPRL